MQRRVALILAVAALLAGAGCHAQPDSPLMAAAGRGDTTQIEALLAQGTSVNETGGRGGTALISAARSGHIPALKTLLERGADPNLRGGVNGWTPLMHAIHKFRKASVVALLDGGADVNASTASGTTALMMAAGYGDAEMVGLLLERGANPFAETPGGGNALEAAVGGVPDIDKFTVGDCQTATVRTLLEHAPGLKLKDNSDGWRARWTARLGRCSEVLTLLGQRDQAAR